MKAANLFFFLFFLSSLWQGPGVNLYSQTISPIDSITSPLKAEDKIGAHLVVGDWEFVTSDSEMVIRDSWFMIVFKQYKYIYYIQG